MVTVNNKEFLLKVHKKLYDSGINTFIFGGWAEELLGIIKPRDHKDIDLLYLADDFELVDQFIKKNNLLEVLQKRFTHKRAFEVDGILVEIFLVNKSGQEYTTDFFGNYKFVWPTDTFSKNLNEDVLMVSPDALAEYRKEHKNIMKKAVPLSIRKTWV